MRSMKSMFVLYALHGQTRLMGKIEHGELVPRGEEVTQGLRQGGLFGLTTFRQRLTFRSPFGNGALGRFE